MYKVQLFTCWRFNKKDDWTFNVFRITYRGEDYSIPTNQMLSIIILNFGILFEKPRKKTEADVEKTPNNNDWQLGKYWE